MCDLSELLYKVMLWNTGAQGNLGSEEDIDKRRQLFAALQQWRRRLPEHLREDTNFTPQTCFLRSVVPVFLLFCLQKITCTPACPQTYYPLFRLGALLLAILMEGVAMAWFLHDSFVLKVDHVVFKAPSTLTKRLCLLGSIKPN